MTKTIREEIYGEEECKCCGTIGDSHHSAECIDTDGKGYASKNQDAISKSASVRGSKGKAMGFKIKNHDYLNTKTKRPQYGFKIFIGGEWCLAAEDNKLILFDTPEERDAAVKELKAGN